MRIAVLGAGSVRCSPAIIGSFAGYFGERPLDLVFWDMDAERLDLFDRFARLCFGMNKATHHLVSTEEPDEALADAQALILAIGSNCAHKFLNQRGSLIGHGETDSVLTQRCASELLNMSALDAAVLSLIDVEPDGREWLTLKWPPEPNLKERQAVPHQILRYLNGDEYPHQFIRSSAPSPLTLWLDSLGQV